MSSHCGGIKFICFCKLDDNNLLQNVCVIVMSVHTRAIYEINDISNAVAVDCCGNYRHFTGYLAR